MKWLVNKDKGEVNEKEFDDVVGGVDGELVMFDDLFFMDDGGDVDFDVEYDFEDGVSKVKKKVKSKFMDDDDVLSKMNLKKVKKVVKCGEVDE